MKTCALLYCKSDQFLIDKEHVKKMVLFSVQITQHPHFLQVYYSTELPGGRIGLVCEYPGDEIVTLRDWMHKGGYFYCGTMQENTTKILNLMLQLFTAVSFMHERKEIHGCLSPDSILICSEGKCAKIVHPTIYSPSIYDRNRFFGGDFNYWAPSQEAAYKKACKYIRTTKNPNLVRAAQLSSISALCDEYSLYLIFLEIVFKGRFWNSGADLQIPQKLLQAQSLTSLPKGDILKAMSSMAIKQDVMDALSPTMMYCLNPNNTKVSHPEIFRNFIETYIRFCTRKLRAPDFWSPFFDERQNETKILNNIGVGYYISGDEESARKFFRLGMMINSRVAEPDPLLIYNYSLLEQKIAGAEEEIGIKCLHRCRESPERNILIFILRLKQAIFFNESFFKYRFFDEDFYQNDALKVLLKNAFIFIEKNKGSITHRPQILAIRTLEGGSEYLETYILADFAVGLVMSHENLHLILTTLGRVGNQSILDFKILNRRPRTWSNISVLSLENSEYYIIFGIENVCTIYLFDNTDLSLSRTVSKDLFSDITFTAEDGEGRMYASLNNNDIFNINTSTVQHFERFIVTKKKLIGMKASKRFIALLYEDKTIATLNLATNQFIGIELRKIRFFNIINKLNYLLAANFKHELVIFDLDKMLYLPSVQISESILLFDAPRAAPFALIYGVSGFVDVVSLLNGSLINRLGPFNSIYLLQYDSLGEVLAILDAEHKIQLILLPLSNQEELKGMKNDILIKPVLVHNLDSTLLSESRPDLVSKIREITDLAKDALISNDKMKIAKLENLGEDIKREINVAEHPEMLAILRILSTLKYDNGEGLLNITYNYIFEEYSYCEDVDNSFELRILAFSISNCKRFFAFVPSFGSIFVYATANREKLQEIKITAKEAVIALAFSKGGRYLVLAQEEKQLRVFNIKTGKLVFHANIRNGASITGLYSADYAKLIAISRADSTIDLFDLESFNFSGEPIRLYTEHKHKVCFRSDSDIILIYGGDNLIRCWIYSQLRRLHSLTGHSGAITCLLFLNGGQMITLSLDRTIRFWSLEEGVCNATFKVLEGEPRHADISKDGRLLLVVQDYSQLAIYDLLHKALIFNYEDQEEIIEAHWISAPSVILVHSIGNIRCINIHIDYNAN